MALGPRPEDPADEEAQVSTVSVSTPVTTRLRAETSAIHQDLEDRLDLLGPLSRARYCLLLKRFLGFHAVLEPRLDHWHEVSPLLDWSHRRKVAGLVADLADLGRHPGVVTPCPRVPNIPTRHGTAVALGILYVVEGATLGGRTIAVRLATDEAIAGRATRFFTSYGDQLGRRWHDYRDVLTTWVGDDHTRADDVVAAAQETFQVLADWLAPAAAVAWAAGVATNGESR